MRIAATWKPRWTRVTSARMMMHIWDVIASGSCAADRDRSRNRWSLCVLMNMKLCLVETLAICSSKKTVHQSFRESNTTACLWPELDTGDSTESFCRSRDCDVYLFPTKLSVTESLAFGTLWMFLFSIQASGAGRSFFQCCCEGKGKAACGRHGSGALRIDFQKCVTKLSCMTIEELTNCRESLHVDARRCSLWGLWTVSRECHKILQNCPQYRRQKIDDYVQHSHESNNGMCACVRAQTTW